MIYLLDVSAILSLVSINHQFRPSMDAWLKTLHAGRDTLATCAITELGAVRILPQSDKGAFTISDVQITLARMKKASVIPFIFLSDDLGVDRLPTWVTQPKHTTNGHLAALAKTHGAILATFDKNIPGSFVIPLR